MSNNDLLSERFEQCCSPLTAEPLVQTDAVELARVFKALGDPARLRLLSLIASHASGEACVCEISGAFDLSQSTISHHLKALREAGLLDRERRGVRIYHKASPSALGRLTALFGAAESVGASA